MGAGVRMAAATKRDGVHEEFGYDMEIVSSSVVVVSVFPPRCLLLDAPVVRFKGDI